MSELNRRNALVAVASMTAVGIPTTALAASSPSTPAPIFAAIDARKKAEARSYNACCRLGAFQESHRASDGELPSVEDHLELDELEAANDGGRDEDVDAIRAMFSTAPATAAGAVALLRYVRECEADGDDILQIYMDEAGERQGVNALFDSLIASFTPLAT